MMQINAQLHMMELMMIQKNCYWYHLGVFVQTCDGDCTVDDGLHCTHASGDGTVCASYDGSFTTSEEPTTTEEPATTEEPGNSTGRINTFLSLVMVSLGCALYL